MWVEQGTRAERYSKAAHLCTLEMQELQDLISAVQHITGCGAEFGKQSCQNQGKAVLWRILDVKVRVYWYLEVMPLSTPLTCTP